MLKYVVLYYFCCTWIIDGYTNFRFHKNWPKAMEKICGEIEQDRIIGGKYAQLGQYPWMAQLVYRNKWNEVGPHCAGSLITPLHVISAAHCIYQNIGELLYVVLGEYDTKTNPDCDDGIFKKNCAAPIQRIKIAHINVPKSYVPKDYRNDISLLKLKRPAHLNGWVSPICLPTGTEIFGVTAEVAGWGMTKKNQITSMPNILKYVKLPILDMDVCRMYISAIINGTKQICAGSMDSYQDACGGDSGAPLMQITHGNNGPKYYQIGLVSYGQLACGYAPAIYTRLSAHMDFILNKLV